MDKSIHHVDAHVGAAVKARRLALGISQTVLADRIGVTFQQVQKYETGINRIAASRLYDIARVLEVSLDSFFDGLPE